MFYTNPNRSFYVREITRKIEEQINSVRRELANLLSIGIISSDTTNNRLYYEVNQKYEYYDAFQTIFGGAAAKPKKGKAVSATKDAGPADDLKSLGKVDLALLTGQFTRDEGSGIDLLVVGDINQHAIEKYVAELEAREGKEIRYAVMSTENFLYRRQINDRFIIKIIEAKKQILTNSENLLEEE